MNIIVPFNEDRGVFRPELTIAVTNEITGKTIITNALIDSGADVTVFPSIFFEALGIDYKKKAGNNKSKIFGVSGNSLNVLQFKIDIVILKNGGNKPFKRVQNVLVNSVDSKETHILLGTNFFYPEFKVTLDYTNKMIMLEC